MKKLITWLTKGSKVTRILKYIYRALVIAKGALAGGISGTAEAGVTGEVVDKISSSQKYLELAIEYLGVIMGWFGISAQERDALATSEISVDELRRACEEATK